MRISNILNTRNYNVMQLDDKALYIKKNELTNLVL